MPNPTQRLQARYLWLFAFCFATTTALLFTKIALPMLPSLNGGSGLLKNDAVFFQQSAILLADTIQTHGWSTWSIWSTQTNTSGNVGILSALYALFGSHDPALIIPINAFFHASSAYLLLLIGREIWPGRIGNFGGLIAAGLFIIFPSALSWYSQPLKDSYVIAGTLLVLYALVRLLEPPSIKRGVLNLVWLMVGICLIVFVKPYYIKLLLVIVTTITLIIIAWAIWMRAPHRYRLIFFYLIATSLTIGVSKWIPQTYLNGMTYENYTASQSNIATSQSNIATSQSNIATSQSIKAWSWKSTSYLPDIVNRYLETAARTRLGLIQYNQAVGANTLIDGDHIPDSIFSIITYLPRALQVGLFTPFPNTWLENPSLPKLGVIAETMIWYFIAIGVLLTLLYRRSIQLSITLIFALFFITVFSFVGPNVGTLYRSRYAFEFLMILIGVVGWISFISRRYIPNFFAVKPTDLAIENELVAPITAAPSDSKTTLVRSAIVVSTLTLIGSLGFFARDFLMTRWFGIGSEMDGFILGAMFPMLIVAVFSIPAGIAIIPVYTIQHHNNPELAKRLLTSSALALSALLTALAVSLYVFLPQLFSLLNWNYTASELLNIRYIANIYLLVLWLSGLVILANSALTATGKMMFPSIAQLVVPITTLIALAIFGTHYGVYPVVYAMLIGQGLNLILVGYVLHHNHLLPESLSHPLSIYRHLPIRQYTFLMMTALSTAVLIPVTNSMAANLSVGSVAIIGIGTKVVLLITGVIGIGINTVLLPYFSSLIAKLQHVQAKSDFSFFLLWLTLLSIPTTLVLTLLVEPVVHILFAGSKLTELDLHTLTKVIQYGIIQLPFYACAIVATKYITAHKRTGMILLAALAALVFTVVIGSALSKVIGVAGITLAMALAATLSATVLVFYTNYMQHLSIADSLFIGFNWILFLTLFLFLHFQVYVGLIIASIAYVVFILGNWQILIRE